MEWEGLAAMPTARSGLAAAVLNGRLVVVGGEVNSADPNGVFPQVEVYDFATGTWASLDAMPVPRHGIGAAAVGDLLYVPGGATRAGFGATAHHDALRIF
jgi:N-acetylneuraminic acid mutarotase